MNPLGRLEAFLAVVIFLGVSFEDLRRDQAEDLIPGLLRTGAIHPTQLLRPDLVHRDLEGAQVLRAEAVELNVLPTELLEVRNDDKVQGIEMVHRYLDCSHETGRMAAEHDVPAEFVQGQVAEGGEGELSVRRQFEDPEEDANAHRMRIARLESNPRLTDDAQLFLAEELVLRSRLMIGCRRL